MDFASLIEHARQNGWLVTVNPLRGGIVCTDYVELQRDEVLIVCQFDQCKHCHESTLMQACKYSTVNAGPWELSVTVSDPISIHLVEKWIVQ